MIYKSMDIAYMAEMGFHTVYLFIFVFPSYTSWFCWLMVMY